MSIQSEINRIKAAVAALAASITNKGVTVPDGTKLDGMAALVDSIQQGGSEDWKITDGRYLFYQGARWDIKDKLLPHLYHITIAQSMFSNMEGDVDLSEFDLSSVEDARALMSYCQAITSIVGLYLPNCTNAASMCLGCKNITEVDLSSVFGAENVIAAGSMFQNCSGLKTAKVVGRLSTASYLFGGCAQLESVDMSGVNFENGTTIANIFASCSSLKSVDFSGVDMSGVNNANYAFNGCSALEEIVEFAVPLATKLTSPFPVGSSSFRNSLTRLTFKNISGGYSIRAAFSIAYNNFSRDGMVEMFNSLPDITSLGLTSTNTKITITGNPCVTDGTITDTDRSIATGKGWTLVE